MLTAEQIAAKLNGYRAGEIPLGCNHLTMFIDVQQKVLFWMLCAWEDNFTGYVVDYGTLARPEAGVLHAAGPAGDHRPGRPRRRPGGADLRRAGEALRRAAARRPTAARTGPRCGSTAA